MTCNLPHRFLAGPVLQAGRYFYEVRIVEILDPFDAQGEACLQVELAVVVRNTLPSLFWLLVLFVVVGSIALLLPK